MASTDEPVSTGNAENTGTGIESEDGQAAFGAWVRAERVKKGWTQVRLAEASGISQVSVHKIEVGKTVNPSPTTRDNIINALGVKPDAAMIEEAEKEAAIPGGGSLYDFDPHDPSDYPDVKGVYIFYDRTKRPVYIGSARKRSIAVRVKEHTEKFWFREPVVYEARYFEVEKTEECLRLEKILIKVMRTHLLLNRKDVEDDATED